MRTSRRSAVRCGRPPTKVAGKYLGPYIRGLSARSTRGVRRPRPLRAIPHADEAEHEQAVDRSSLAAADADARIGDFEGAIRWLSLVEELNLVIPPEYVARRHDWRRQLDPDAPPDAAAERIDPSFASADAAISDLQRRVGWLREIEHRTGGEMRDHLATLDEGMDHLLGLSRRAGSFRADDPRTGDPGA